MSDSDVRDLLRLVRLYEPVVKAALRWKRVVNSDGSVELEAVGKATDRLVRAVERYVKAK